MIGYKTKWSDLEDAIVANIKSIATFGGTLNGSGMVKSITEAFTKLISGRKSLVSATVATGLFCNMTTGDQFLSIILTSNLYKKLYADMGYEGRLLSRTTEDACTVTSVLIPWNSCGMTQSTVLKVATVEYQSARFPSFIQSTFRRRYPRIVLLKAVCASNVVKN